MIFVKTEAGIQMFEQRLQFTLRQRSAFILFDGQRSVADVLYYGLGVTLAEVEQMVELGWLGPLNVKVPPSLTGRAPDAAATLPAIQAETVPAALDTAQQRYLDAYPIATRLTASLGLRGFRLNLSVEASSGYLDLVALAPKIRAAVGAAKAEPLDHALGL